MSESEEKPPLLENAPENRTLIRQDTINKIHRFIQRGIAKKWSEEKIKRKVFEQFGIKLMPQ